MRKRNNIRRAALRLAALGAAGLAILTGPAYAAGPNTAPALPENNDVAAISVPVDLCGGHLGLGPGQAAECAPAQPAYAALDLSKLPEATRPATEGGAPGLLNGARIPATVRAPIRVCGVGVPVFGEAHATCAGTGTTVAA